MDLERRVIFAIGDIHGEIGKLQSLLEQIEHFAATFDDEKLGVFLGDYIDRGPDSRAVVELLSSGKALSFPYVCLMGNHEDMAVNPDMRDVWMNPRNGGPATLASYGGAIDLAHKRWMSELPTSYRSGKWFFVHAGIRPDQKLAEQDRETMLWIRARFLSYSGPFDEGVTVVHGHTPVDEPEIEEHRINLDTGAVFGGALTCAILTDRLEGMLFAGKPPHGMAAYGS